MKRLASRLTRWHMLPHRSTPRSTPQNGRGQPWNLFPCVFFSRVRPALDRPFSVGDGGSANGGLSEITATPSQNQIVSI